MSESLRVGFGILAVLPVLVAGCVSTTKVEYQPPVIHIEKLPVAVTLNLSKEFCSYTHAKSTMGTSFQIPLGPAMREYATYVAVNTFERVHVNESASNEASNQTSRLILEPRVAKVEEVIPARTSEEHRLLLVVEWVVKDAKSGQLLLLLPLEANSSRVIGWGHSVPDCAQIQLRDMLKTLTTNTVMAFGSAKELKTLRDQ